MGKHKNAFKYTVVDPKTLHGTEWPEVEKALRLFKEAATTVKQSTIKRSSLKERADMAMFGFLLHHARLQYLQNTSRETRKTTVTNGQARGASGQFESSGNGFYRWLNGTFPGICLSSAKNYMRLAQNLGFVPGMPPDYLDDNKPVLKRLGGRLKDLYKSPSTYQYEQRLKQLRRTKQTPSLELQNRVSFRESLEIVRDEISKIKLSSRHAGPSDLDTFIELLQAALTRCEKVQMQVKPEAQNA